DRAAARQRMPADGAAGMVARNRAEQLAESGGLELGLELPRLLEPRREREHGHVAREHERRQLARARPGGHVHGTRQVPGVEGLGRAPVDDRGAGPQRAGHGGGTYEAQARAGRGHPTAFPATSPPHSSSSASAVSQSARTGARSNTPAAARTQLPVSAKSESMVMPNAAAIRCAVRERGSERL